MAKIAKVKYHENEYFAVLRTPGSGSANEILLRQKLEHV